MDAGDDTASGFGARAQLAGSFVNELALDAAEPERTLTKTQRKRRKRETRKLNFRDLLPAAAIADPVKPAGQRTEMKYYEQRYSLFSLYDRGIQLDDESWYSVTPEQLAAHHAQRCHGDVIIDGCCGVGGNTIAFAATCRLVVAIDVDPLKIAMARHNAAIYGRSNIEWLVGDFVQLAESGALDRYAAAGVFLSPPWGGPAYTRRSAFTFDDMPVDGLRMWCAARRLSLNVALFLPRNFDCETLRWLVSNDGRAVEYCEVESNYLNDRCKGVTAYVGDWAGRPDTRKQAKRKHV